MPRFRHQELEIVWAGYLTLPPGLQYVFYRAVADQFAVPTSGRSRRERQARIAVQDLHLAAEALGRPPTRKAYIRLRIERPELRLHPESNIRRWLGAGWSGCLEQACLDAENDGDFVSCPYGLTHRFSAEEAYAAVRECVKSLGHVPSLPEYLQWVRRPDILQLPGRRPRSINVFTRLGGWRKVLADAGVIADAEIRYAVDGRPLPRRFAYLEDEKRAALLTVAERLERSPRPMEYARAREVIAAETAARGEMHLLPTHHVIRRHFGSWDYALQAVGLEAVGSRLPPFTGKRRPSYTRDEKVGWVERAWTTVGEPFTQDAYRRWRESALEDRVDIPSVACLCKTFGNWTAVREAVVPSSAQSTKRRRIHE